MAVILFPLDARKVKWDSEVNQSWEVNEQKSASGKRRALTYQSLPGWTFAITFPALSSAEKDTLFGFFAKVKGSLIPFFYKDAENYKCENITLPKNSDGTFQLLAKIGSQVEPVEYADKIKVYINGTPQGDNSYTLDRGAIAFRTAPAATAKVTASYEYYWKVVFAKSKIQIKQRFDNLFKVSLSLEVVR